MIDRFTVHSAADLRLLAWSAAEMDRTQDRMLQRKDRYGYPIRWEDYEDEGPRFGWFIDGIRALRSPASHAGRLKPGGTDG